MVAHRRGELAAGPLPFRIAWSVIVVANVVRIGFAVAERSGVSIVVLMLVTAVCAMWLGALIVARGLAPLRFFPSAYTLAWAGLVILAVGTVLTWVVADGLATSGLLAPIAFWYLAAIPPSAVERAPVADTRRQRNHRERLDVAPRVRVLASVMAVVFAVLTALGVARLVADQADDAVRFVFAAIVPAAAVLVYTALWPSFTIVQPNDGG